MKVGRSKKAKKPEKKIKEKKAKREHRISFMLNDAENNALERHLKKYKIKNKSKWYREMIFSQVWKAMGEDYPRLFKEEEMMQ